MLAVFRVAAEFTSTCFKPALVQSLACFPGTSGPNRHAHLCQKLMPYLLMCSAGLQASQHFALPSSRCCTIQIFVIRPVLIRWSSRCHPGGLTMERQLRTAEPGAGSWDLRAEVSRKKKYGCVLTPVPGLIADGSSDAMPALQRKNRVKGCL